MQNTAELREFLLERMEKLIKGEETIAQSNAVARLAHQVNQTLALEVQARDLIQKGAMPAIAIK